MTSNLPKHTEVELESGEDLDRCLLLFAAVLQWEGALCWAGRGTHSGRYDSVHH